MWVGLQSDGGGKIVMQAPVGLKSDPQSFSNA